jgi:hypothetical protein
VTTYPNHVADAQPAKVAPFAGVGVAGSRKNRLDDFFQWTNLGRVVMCLALCVASPVVINGAEPAPMTSTKERGVVSIAPDAALSQGRLVLKVVAFNRTRDPAAFGAADVTILTAAGKPVALVPLEQLIDEAVKASGSKRRVSSVEHNPADYSHPQAPVSQSGAGEPDVSGYTGGGNPTSGVISAHTNTGTHESPADARVREQVNALRAGILQSTLIPSATATGGQVVSEKLKFARKEERALRVRVEFNGEQHEFTVVPPAQ